MRVFESIVQLLDDFEQYRHNTANVSTRENMVSVADSNIREVVDLEWYGFDPYTHLDHMMMVYQLLN